MNARTDFWRGDFGNAYNSRSPGNVKANFHFFQRALKEALVRRGPHSICELGAGTGMNLRALQELLGVGMAAVEVNAEAAARIPADAEVFNESLLDWVPPRTWDLAFTKGVLIHIAPEDLPNAYDTLWNTAGRYILIAEYRGHKGRLWKRDFAKDLLQRFSLSVLDYGFAWSQDPLAPQDDLTWFLMEKNP